MDEAVRILLTYGPGGVIATLLVLGILIPKSFYDREVKRGDSATEAASKNAEALKEVSTAINVVATENTGLKSEIKSLVVEIRLLRDEVISLRQIRGA